MEFSRVFCKELPKIFSANLAENNEIEQIEFKKSKLCAISELSIDQGIASNVFLPNVE